MHSLHLQSGGALVLLTLLLLLTPPSSLVNGKAVANSMLSQQAGESRQLFLGAKGKETSTPNFVRLVVMRLIYGIASTMGLEERLDGAFSGAFVPPNADNDLFGLGGGGGGDEGGLFGGGGGDDDLLSGIFDDGGLL